MGTKHPSIATPWFRVMAGLGLLTTPVVLWLGLRDDVPRPLRIWWVVACVGGALTSAFWLVTGKTVRMKVGELVGESGRPVRPDDGAYFRSKAGARWWLAGAAAFVLAVIATAIVVAAEASSQWLFVPWGLAGAVGGLHRWWFWPAWAAGESEGSLGRLWWRPGASLEHGWSAARWREAFRLAGIHESQVPKARAAFFTLLVGGMAGVFAATEATNPEEYATADALVRDLNAAGLGWDCQHIDVDAFGYERAAYEADAALCRRVGERILVHVFRRDTEGEVESPALVPGPGARFTNWVRGPLWIVETTDRVVAEQIQEEIGGGLTSERPED